MPSESEFRELVPVLIATLVAAVGVFALFSDLKKTREAAPTE